MIDGVWNAFPNLDYFKLDDEYLKEVIKRLFRDGVRGIMALGTTGQGPDKTLRKRKEEVERFARCCSPEQLVVGVSANSSEDVRSLIDHAASCGVRGVAITSPYYGKYTEAELHEWLDEALNNSPEGLEYYMYNIPGAMHHRWTLESLSVASTFVPVSGIKDSSGDVSQLIEFVTYAQENSCSLMVGDERMGLYSLLMGGSGFISGFSGAFPSLMSNLFEAGTSRDLEKAIPLQKEVNKRVNDLLKYPPREMVKVIVQQMQENGIA